MNEQTDYKAYLLRLKRGRGQSHWRAMLQDTTTGEIMRFATERDLTRYLLRALRVEAVAQSAARTQLRTSNRLDVC